MKAEIVKLIRKADKAEHGFKGIEQEAVKIVHERSLKENVGIAKKLYASEVHQARMLATFIFGLLSSKSDKVLGILRKQVSLDDNWRVQEILAKAFDRYCANTGYEKALPVIKSWLTDKNPNVRRAVSEGLRIWTNRDYFKDHPEVAVQLLAGLKDDASDYVRTSAGNALRDISKRHKELVKAELQKWDVSQTGIMQTYKSASRFLQ